MNKKVLLILFPMLLLFGCTQQNPPAPSPQTSKPLSSNSPLIKASTISGKPGQTVDFQLMVDQIPNKGLNMILCDLKYDKTKLQAQKVIAGNIISKATDIDYNADENLPEGMRILFVVNDDQDESLIKNDGHFCTVQFLIKENTPIGDLPITFIPNPDEVGYYVGKIGQDQFIPIDANNCTGGMIKVVQ
jgi:hypothetical protein